MSIIGMFKRLIFPAQKLFDIYEPRYPRKTHYFQCVQNHFEDLEMA